MRFRSAVGLCAVLLSSLSAQTTSTGDVGSGAPTDSLRRSFVAAWYRNLFYTQVAMPPLADVKKFGTTGLVQEFQDANKTSGVKYALLAPNTAIQPGDGSDVFQLLSPLYNYYTSVGLNTAGNPSGDTLNCPSSTPYPCVYQLFDKKYALFAYLQATPNGQNFAVRDPYYTKWVGLGGIQGLGAVLSAETAVTTSAGSVGTIQTFAQGMIANITQGLLTGRLVAVAQPIYNLYVQNGGATGFLGFPAGNEIVLPNGNHRQSFEGGTVDYGPDGVPFLRLPVYSVVFQSSLTTVKLNLGDTYPVQAVAYTATGQVLTDRTINYVTSNSRVVSIQPSVSGAVVRAVGGGTAKVTATAEGKSSGSITFFVSAPCCGIGEGAPTGALQSLFQDAVNRNRLTVQLPAANPVRRSGSGYVQELFSVDPNNPVRYLLAVSDNAALAYVVTGSILSAYEALGGPAQFLGYPTGDAVYDSARTPRQTFEKGALAGSPVRAVTAPFLQKWALSGYESGPAGYPAGNPETLLSFLGTDATSQAFQKSVFYAANSGAQAGKVYLVTGMPLAKYLSLGGGRGQLGLPITDEYGLSGKRRQDFEGGSLEYAPGDTEAKLIEKARTPAVTVTPGIVPAGTRARIGVGGFPDGATIRVSVTGHPDFMVTAQTGAYAWDIFVPQTSATGTVTVRAVNIAGTDQTAQGTYMVRALADVKARITKLIGDTQTAPPGAALPQKLRVAVRDDAGNVLAGIPVKFTASPGASVVSASVATDSAGEAEASVRLPMTEGVALFNVEAARQVATFSARSAQGSVNAFPRLMQTSDVPVGNGTATLTQAGSLLASAASIVRLYQNRGQLPQGNGPADPVLLNQFLKQFCEFDSNGTQICDGFLVPAGSDEQIANLWRLSEFAPSLDVSVVPAAPDAIRDLIAADSPVLVTLAIRVNGTAAGTHNVVAIGIGGDGSILIHDPNPAYGRASLQEYLSGFSVASGSVRGVIASAIRLIPNAPSNTGFLLTASSGDVMINSPAGPCGTNVLWPLTNGGSFLQRYCDGSQGNYQIDISSDTSFDGAVSDLGSQSGQYHVSGGGGTAAFRASRPGAQLLLSAQDLAFTTRGVVNAATFTADMAPGGLVAIFGAGLARAGATTRVEVDDRSAPVLLATAFQLNVQVPADLSAGTHLVRVISPYGTLEQPFDLQTNAPAIFRINAGIDTDNRGAILNSDGKLNLSSNPARRGSTISVYGTGFGAIVPSGSLYITAAPVTAVLGGVELPVQFAGLAPGFIGLYQINLALPQASPPGLGVVLTFRQAGVESSPVQVAIQ